MDDEAREEAARGEAPREGADPRGQGRGGLGDRREGTRDEGVALTGGCTGTHPSGARFGGRPSRPSCASRAPRASRASRTPRLAALARALLGALGSLVAYAGLLVAACLLVFLALDLLPGNAATQQLGLTATAEQVQALAHSYGLDLPVLERFVAWGADALHGDLGVALSGGRPVAAAMAGPLLRTAVMFCASFVLVALVGGGLGVAAGLRAGRPLDRAASAGALVVRGLPEFVVGIFLVYAFATTLHLLPAVSLVPVGGSAFDDPKIFVLPVATMSVVGASCVVRPVRAVVAAANQAPDVEAARLAGVGEARVVARHLLPRCVAPAAQVLATRVASSATPSRPAPPCSTRASTSRPRASVPRRWPGPGAANPIPAEVTPSSGTRRPSRATASDATNTASSTTSPAPSPPR